MTGAAAQLQSRAPERRFGPELRDLRVVELEHQLERVGLHRGAADDPGPRDGESFLETGTIDSTGVLEVVMFLEQRFELKVEDRELIPENLDSVDNLVRFVIRKTPRLQPQLEHAA